jgi:hypothetical protein
MQHHPDHTNFMKSKDFSPYTIISESPEALKLQLKKGNRILLFITFRITPLLLLAFWAWAPEDIRRTLPPLLYWGLFISIIAIVVASLFHRYTPALTFSGHGMILGFNLCFFQWSETEVLKPADEILVAKEQAARGVYWMFYRMRQGQKKKLFRIPAFLTENLASRNNFIAVFEQRCNAKTTIQS